MSILGTILAADVSDLRNPALWLKQTFGSRTKAGEAVSEASALGLSSYYAAIRTISEDIAKLPLPVYRRMTPRGKEKIPDHPVAKLLDQSPNDNMEAMLFRETLQHHAMGWGNGYAMIERDDLGVPESLWPVQPWRVRVEQENDVITYNVRNDDGTVANLKSDQVFHIRGLGSDGILGYSIARMAAESIGLGLATETFGNNFFANGTHMSGVLKTPNRVKKEQHEQLRAQWNEMYAGSDNAMKPAILEQGMEWQRLGIEPESAQFLQTRYFTVEEMARWFRITPHKLQHLLRSTFNNIESLNIQYVTDTLMPWLVRWEQQIKRKLLNQDEEVFAEHLILGLLRGDAKARSDYYNRRFHIGTLSQNDIRELENENPIDDGDVYYVPMNLQRTEDAAAEPEEPEPPPVVPPAPERDEEEIERRREEEENTPDESRATPRVARSFLPVFTDAFARVLAKEEKAVTRAAKRHHDDPEAFYAWVDKFYAEQYEFCDEVTTAGRLSLGAVLDSPLCAGDTPRIAVHESKAAVKDSYRTDPNSVAEQVALYNKGRDAELAIRMLKELTNGTHN